MARPKKDAPPKELRSLMKIAQDMSYEPGVGMVTRMVEQGQILAAWKDDLEHGIIPTDMHASSMGEARRMYWAEMADFSKFELAILEYFHPKLRSTESSMKVEGEIGLLELLTRDRTG